MVRLILKGIGNALATVFAFVDQFAGVFRLLRRKFAFAPEFQGTSRLSCSAGPFADKAALKLGQQTNYLPHGADAWGCSVDGFDERAELNQRCF